MTTMFIDHLGVALGQVGTGFHGGRDWVMYLRFIGRVAFPIFAFLLTEGATHTRHMNKYMGRLALFAIISQVPYALLRGTSVFSGLNIFFTLLLALGMIALYQKIADKSSIYLVAYTLCVFGAGMLADLLRTDYGGVGVLFIVLIYIVRHKAKSRFALLLAIACGLLLIYQTSVFYYFALLSLIPIYFYSGQLGKKSTWLFYSFYPLHMLLLVAGMMLAG